MAVAATVAAGTVAVGPVRGLVLCLPGILGMAAGGATGWLWRAGPPRGPKDAQSCENRLWLAGGAAVLYAVGTAATVSLLRAGLMGAPLATRLYTRRQDSSALWSLTASPLCIRADPPRTLVPGGSAGYWARCRSKLPPGSS